jgi:hypothetical protein
MQVQSHRCDLLQAAGDLVVQVPGVLHQDRIWFPIAQSQNHALGQAGAPTIRLKGFFRAGGKGSLLNPIESCLPWKQSMGARAMLRAPNRSSKRPPSHWDSWQARASRRTLQVSESMGIVSPVGMLLQTS